jgi:hypothetical protein
MTGDCHVRFCERLRGETPLCLLGVIVASKFIRMAGNDARFGTKKADDRRP